MADELKMVLIGAAKCFESVKGRQSFHWFDPVVILNEAVIEGRVGNEAVHPEFRIKVKLSDPEDGVQLITDVAVTVNWPATGQVTPSEATLLASFHKKMALAACAAEVYLRGNLRTLSLD